MKKPSDKSRIKVRFNLGRGVNYMKWKVEVPGQEAMYLDPNEFQLVMTTCSLRNHRRIAERINQGENKSVCAWILCDSLDVFEVSSKQELPSHAFRLYYDPRVLPYWHTSRQVVHDFDNTDHFMIVSEGKKLFCLSHR